MSTILSATGLTVRYGRQTAVDDVSISIGSGTVYALLGRNGAGKSSLVRCLLGQSPPQQGRVELFGHDVWKHRARLMARVGVVAEEADAPPESRVRDLAWFQARLYPQWDTQAFARRLDRFGIDGKTRFGDLSKGQKKQVSLALALSTAPELLILDDPTLGLDVVARKSFFEEVLGELADRGITVFITTHDLAAVEGIADRIGMLRRGRLVLDEETETLKSRFRRIRLAAPAMNLAQAELVAASVRQWGSGTEAVVTNFDEEALERLDRRGSVAEVVPMSLEEIFIAVVGEEGVAA